MPKLSVLLSVRNGAPTIAAAVRSTLRTLPRDAELVVLNDGSTDGTAAVLDRIEHPRLVVMHGSGAGGLGKALNHMLETTDSQYVGRMDADDISLPGRFQRAVATLDRDRSDFVFATSVTFGGRRVPRPSLPLPIANAAFPFHLLLGNPVRHDTLTARRASIEGLGGYRQVPSEDYDLWLRAARAGMRLSRRGGYGLAYREHPAQLTAVEDWRERSHQDPLLGTSFAELSSHLLGEPFPRLVNLATAENGDEETILTRFEKAFRAAMASLSWPDRRQLGIKLNRRGRYVRRRLQDGPSREANR